MIRRNKLNYSTECEKVNISTELENINQQNQLTADYEQ